MALCHFLEPLQQTSIIQSILRGILDAGGSVFVSKKPGSSKYLAIATTKVSPLLALQIREILLCAGFRVTILRFCISKNSAVRAYKICLCGKENLKKGLEEIGFSNPYELERAANALS